MANYHLTVEVEEGGYTWALYGSDEDSEPLDSGEAEDMDEIRRLLPSDVNTSNLTVGGNAFQHGADAWDALHG